MSIISLLLAIAKAVPIVDQWVRQLTQAYFIQKFESQGVALANAVDALANAKTEDDKKKAISDIANNSF